MRSSSSRTRRFGEELTSCSSPEELPTGPLSLCSKDCFISFTATNRACRLRTQTVSAIVRGTEFTVEVAQDGYNILDVLDGAAEVSAHSRPRHLHALHTMQTQDISQLPVFEAKQPIGANYEDRF